MKKYGFTLIELIVVMAIIGILVMLSFPKYLEYQKDARLTKIIVQAKELEKACEKYYMTNNDWPRLSDDAYTSEGVQAFGERVLASTGKVVELDPNGFYYDIDYANITRYIKTPLDKDNYILQNPIGNIFVIEGITDAGKGRTMVNTIPEAVISLSSEKGLMTNSTIVWSSKNSKLAQGRTIISEEWEGNQSSFSKSGYYTVRLRVQDNTGIWSPWSSLSIFIREYNPLAFYIPEHELYIRASSYYGTPYVTPDKLIYDPENYNTRWTGNVSSGFIEVEFDNSKVLESLTLYTTSGQFITAIYYDDTGGVIYSDVYTLGSGSNYNSTYRQLKGVFNIKTKDSIKLIRLSAPYSNGGFNYFMLHGIKIT